MSLVLGILPFLTVFVNSHDKITQESKTNFNIFIGVILVLYLVFGVIL